MVIDAEHVSAKTDVNLCCLGNAGVHEAIISHCYLLIDNLIG